MRFLLKRDYKTVLDELTIKKEYVNYLILEGKGTTTYKVRKKSVPYNQKLHEVISCESPYVARYVFVEFVEE